MALLGQFRRTEGEIVKYATMVLHHVHEKLHGCVGAPEAESWACDPKRLGKQAENALALMLDWPASEEKIEALLYGWLPKDRMQLLVENERFEWLHMVIGFYGSQKLDLEAPEYCWSMIREERWIPGVVGDCVKMRDEAADMTMKECWLVMMCLATGAEKEDRRAAVLRKKYAVLCKENPLVQQDAIGVCRRHLNRYTIRLLNMWLIDCVIPGGVQVQLIRECSTRSVMFFLSPVARSAPWSCSVHAAHSTGLSALTRVGCASRVLLVLCAALEMPADCAMLVMEHMSWSDLIASHSITTKCCDG